MRSESTRCRQPAEVGGLYICLQKVGSAEKVCELQLMLEFEKYTVKSEAALRSNISSLARSLRCPA